MPSNNFLHRHPEFPELIRIVGREISIDPALVEKDYWIMHCLYGLQQMDTYPRREPRLHYATQAY
jgi:hypothetical protein